MTVYVDAIVRYPLAQIKPAARKLGSLWCHMTADSEAELHAFAARIGVPRSAFQGNDARPALRHYDLIPSKRRAAVKAGAVEVDAVEHMRARIAKEEQGDGASHGGVPAASPGRERPTGR